MSVLNWMIEWYKCNCDGYWEHCYGIRIQSLDNPGWMIDIDLLETDYEEKEFIEVDRYINDNDWIYCNVKDQVFKGRGSTDKFEEILMVFKNWVES